MLFRVWRRASARTTSCGRKRARPVMPKIETTSGSVAAAELGRTLTHEHCFTGEELVRAQWPHAYDREQILLRCVGTARELRARGVDTVCDPTVPGIGRDVEINLEVTAATGLRFVMATGFFDESYRGWLFPWSVRAPKGPFADYFVHDIEVGIQGSDVKAGFIKCIADEPGMTDDIRMLHEQAAEASLRTRAPIMAHSNALVEIGLEQLKVFIEMGVDPALIQIAHVHDTDDFDYVEAILASGCYIGFDRYGCLGLDTERRNATLLELLERGYGDRILLSGDTTFSTDTSKLSEERRAARRPTYLFDRVIPRLREAGATDAQLDAMLGSNAQGWLTGTAPASAGTSPVNSRTGVTGS